MRAPFERRNPPVAADGTGSSDTGSGTGSRPGQRRRTLRHQDAQGGRPRRPADGKPPRRHGGRAGDDRKAGLHPAGAPAPKLWQELTNEGIQPEDMPVPVRQADLRCCRRPSGFSGAGGQGRPALRRSTVPRVSGRNCRFLGHGEAPVLSSVLSPNHRNSAVYSLCVASSALSPDTTAPPLPLLVAAPATGSTRVRAGIKGVGACPTSPHGQLLLAPLPLGLPRAIRTAVLAPAKMRRDELQPHRPS